MRLKKKAIMFFALLTIAIVAGSLAIYLYFFAPKTLTSAETAGKLESLYSRASGILNLFGNDMNDLANSTISVTTFSTRMETRKNDMSVLRVELLELKNIAHPSYALSINLLDMGLQEFINALDYAHDLKFNNATQSIEQGSSYVAQSKNALPSV